MIKIKRENVDFRVNHGGGSEPLVTQRCRLPGRRREREGARSGGFEGPGDPCAIRGETPGVGAASAAAALGEQPSVVKASKQNGCLPRVGYADAGGDLPVADPRLPGDAAQARAHPVRAAMDEHARDVELVAGRGGAEGATERGGALLAGGRGERSGARPKIRRDERRGGACGEAHAEQSKDGGDDGLRHGGRRLTLKRKFVASEVDEGGESREWLSTRLDAKRRAGDALEQAGASEHRLGVEEGEQRVEHREDAIAPAGLMTNGVRDGAASVAKHPVKQLNEAGVNAVKEVSEGGAGDGCAAGDGGDAGATEATLSDELSERSMEACARDAVKRLKGALARGGTESAPARGRAGGT
jgi:hypothetical protein